ncbi:MAG TPA: bifunctional nicotinamidase/pyrazinamidase [Hanamia sp.]|jgi:nicotinamidase/pyrazinamidase|nr:bifunctional nicotinamidase/pyrazinamidase [Hanamia sp.]
MNALIIVDVQNDFLSRGALAVKDGDAVIPVINSLENKFDLVVATQDWHPADHKSFASAHPGKNVFEEIILDGLPQVLWPDHCVQQTPGAEFSSSLDTKKIEAIFRKGMDKNIDSYSGFFDNGKKKATGMGAYLKGKGISSIYVCGLAADYCVYFTALDGLELGFQSTIITDATRAIDEENFKKVLENFKAKGGKEIRSAQIDFLEK